MMKTELERGGAPLPDRLRTVTLRRGAYNVQRPKAGTAGYEDKWHHQCDNAFTTRRAHKFACATQTVWD